MGKYTGILLVSDWDRTVTGPDRKVPPANTEAVLRFMEEGGLLSIATGHTRLSHSFLCDYLCNITNAAWRQIRKRKRTRNRKASEPGSCLL